MSDVNGAAPAAADSPSMPVDGAPIGEGGNFTQPLGSQIPAEAQANAEPKAPPSLDDSIDRAIEKSAKASKEAPAKVEAKVEVKPEAKEQPRDNGKFVAKDAKPEAAKVAEPVRPVEVKPSHTAGDPPARFTDTAKAKWAEADPEIRGEVARMERELTEGYQKYKAGAEAFDGYRELDDIAKQSGKKGSDVFREYYRMEQMLLKEPENGVETILTRIGITPRQYAEHVLGKSPDETASKSDATIQELRSKNEALEQRLARIEGDITHQKSSAIGKEVAEFAAAHPRFDELTDDIAFFLKTRTNDLSEAYKLAERLNPAPAQVSTTAASSAPVIDLPVQPDKGSKSINGAPSSGSTPAGKKRVALSLDESLDRAFGSLG